FGLFAGVPLAQWAIGTFFTAVVGASCMLSADLVEANYELKASRNEAMELATSAERERIGRDLHDLLGHTLTLISIKADLARRLMDRDPERAREEIQEVQRIARESLDEIREAVAGLRDASVAAEIAHARRALEAAEIELELGLRASSENPETDRTLAMVLREAVTNVVRHSKASRCRIGCERRDRSVVLTIEDDGVGGVLDEGNGVRSMRERVEALSGQLRVSSDNGVRVEAEIPGSFGPELASPSSRTSLGQL
ncbi:MAG: sensor histidine kinase, partial [Myxococcota bacterium]